MRRIATNSALIKEVGYEDATNILEILFASGSRYQYLNVPVSVVEELLKAESMGSYFSAKIRPEYAAKREHEKGCTNVSVFHDPREGSDWHDEINCTDPGCACFCHRSVNRENSHAEKKARTGKSTGAAKSKRPRKGS